MTEASFTKLIGPGGEELWARDLDYEPIKEGIGEFKLEDGTIVTARLVVAKISRHEDPKTGEISYTNEGEPIYNIRHTVLVSTKVLPEMFKKDMEREK